MCLILISNLHSLIVDKIVSKEKLMIYENYFFYE